ncbi:MAG: PIG-L family deacetylase [Anaerolineaceae bacterium]|nr:PIG-L family deacetylase [Betaproteobacteria bacterium]
MKTIVIAPHPDDEVLGVGGTLLRRKAEGAKVAWLIVTAISVEYGWRVEKVTQRSDEIKRITELFGFDDVFALNFPATRLDQVPMSDLVAGVSDAFRIFEPEEVFVPHPSDVHTDHRIVFDAVSSCTKWFRYPSVKRVLAYETISETDFGLGADRGFRPNVFVNIEPFLNNKLRAMDIYASELGAFPFPRSHEAIRALATLRGATSGFKAAEAFELLRERA